MRWVTGLIAAMFAALAAFQTGHSEALWWVPCYSLGLLLSLMTFKTHLSPGMTWFMAICSTVAMFFYFAGFFTLVPYMLADWYAQPAGREAGGLLLAAFAMIPILSVYTCRLKVDCPYAAENRERRLREQHTHTASQVA